MNRYVWLCLTLTLALLRPAFCAPAGLAARIDQTLQVPDLQGGIQAVYVQSLRDGSVWYEHNADLRFLPASNQKLLTSAIALQTLPLDFRYHTTLLRSGAVDAHGTLRGDLYLRGSGDPFLAPDDLREFVQAARAAGIRRVEGRLLADDSRYSPVRYGRAWNWDDMSDYYSPPIGALNLNENLVYVWVTPGAKEGSRATARVEPAGSTVKLVVTATTHTGASDLQVERGLGEDVIRVSGTVSLEARGDKAERFMVPVRDPGLYTVSVLAERLRGEGIVVSGVGRAVAPAGAMTVADHSGPALPELLRRMNKPSDNLAAECLLRAVAAARRPDAPATAQAGAAIAREWFRTLGIDDRGVSMVDGSGLSRMDFVSARSFAKILKAMRASAGWDAFADSLPVAGVDGSLAARMKDTRAQGNCRAKTGSLTGVSNLSGYVTTADGEPLLFVIFTNNHAAPATVARHLEDELVTLLADCRQP